MPFFLKISLATTAREPSGRHDGDVLPSQLGHRLDVGLGDEIPSGLVLKNRYDFDGDTSDRRCQSAAGVGEEIDFTGQTSF